jgi:hypothetical protein
MSGGGDNASAARAEPPARETGAGGAASAARRQHRVVVVGEFNSGKTQLVNALLGAPVLAASFVTRTALPTAVAFAAKPTFSAEIGNRRRIRIPPHSLDQDPPADARWLHVGLPLAGLRTLRLIDTPGLGSGDPERDARTLRICRYAHTLVWCTPAMQAWKASEERAWLSLPGRLRSHGILAVTFADAIALPAQRDRLLARLQAQAGGHFARVVLASELGAFIPSPRGAGLPRLDGAAQPG